MTSGVVLVTGASGLLGRQVYATFKESNKFSKVIGLAFSRAKGDLIKVDLTDEVALSELFKQYKPSVVIHCAAERFPDRAERDESNTLKLNVKTCSTLAHLSLEYNSKLIYISTDYVFDGTSPLYKPTDKPNPLNFYGKTKYLGELEIHKVSQKFTAVRVPVLYGKVEYLGESVVIGLLELIKNKEKEVKVDDIRPRNPTNVIDIAKALLDFAIYEGDLPPHINYSNPVAMTKYKMVQLIAEGINETIDHIKPDYDEGDVNDPNVASRPNDCRMDLSPLKEINLATFECIELKKWFKENYGPKN